MKKIILGLSLLTASLLVTGCASKSASYADEPKEHAEHHGAHWNYEENGPTHWGEFSKTCASGHHQSPVNIVPGKTMSMNHQYDLSMHEDVHSIADIIDNGHSLKVTPQKAGSITLHGEVFNLLQFHFHGKSEHTIDGKRYDLVAHMVHQNPETKQLAVVAIFFKEGEESKVLKSVLSNIGGSADIDPKDLLPSDTAHYYHYVGSLTTPPCSENVQWYLLKDVDTASAEQIQAMRKYYVDNERPVQELYDRNVESN